MANAIMSTGQITLVDLTDQRTASLYLEANQSKIQVYDSNTGVSTPDYTKSEGQIMITPHFFFGNEDYSSKLGHVNLTYTVNGMSVSKIGASDPKPEVGYYQIEKNLYIIKNIGDLPSQNEDKLNLHIVAKVLGGKITDAETGLALSTDIIAAIDFSKVLTGTDGNGIETIEIFYASNNSSIEVPKTWHANLKDVAALSATNKYLWSYQKTTFDDSTYKETPKVIIGTYGDTGTSGISVTKIEQYYALSENSITAPEGNWDSKQPAWKEGTYLWIRTKITYSNGKTDFTTPYCDNSWKVAADAVTKINGSLDIIKSDIKSMQGQIDDSITTYFYDDVPTLNNLPASEWTSNEIKDKHIGDLYYDKNGKAYRFVKDVKGNYLWSVITDTGLTEALNKVNSLQKEVDGQVNIFLTSNKPEEAGKKVKDGDLWMKPDGNYYKASVIEGKVTWSVTNYNVKKVETQYNSNASNTEPPIQGDSGWSTASPIWEEGKYIWQRTVVFFSEGTKTEISKPVCISAAQAKGIRITGEQVFKKGENTGYSPASITLTADPNGGLAVTGWSYKKGNEWISLGKGTDKSDGSNSIVISPSGAYWFNDTATIKVTTTHANYSDVFSIYRVTDGATGQPAKSVFMTNENITFSANAKGEVKGQTVVANVVGYSGATKITPVVGVITGQPAGMTVTTGEASNSEIPITISIQEGSTLGGPEERAGTLAISISSPISTILHINWSKVNNGDGIKEVNTYYQRTNTAIAPSTDTLKGWSKDWTDVISSLQYLWSFTQTIYITGAVSKSTPAIVARYTRNGYDGSDAVFGIVESTSKILFTDEDPTNIELVAKLFVGGKRNESGVTYAWSSLPSSTIESNTSSSILVKREQVDGLKTFICTMTYKGQTYSDRITITDRTDPIVCNIESSKGDKFTNGKISTTLTCRVYDSHGETDIYNAEGLYKYVYTWEKYDKDGVKVKSWTKTGKQISIAAADVKSKATFICIVTKA